MSSVPLFSGTSPGASVLSWSEPEPPSWSLLESPRSFFFCGNGRGQKFRNCLRRKPLAERYHGGGTKGAFAGVRSHTDEKLQIGVLTDMAHHPLVAALQPLLDDEDTEGNADRMRRVTIVHNSVRRKQGQPVSCFLFSCVTAAIVPDTPLWRWFL